MRFVLTCISIMLSLPAIIGRLCITLCPAALEVIHIGDVGVSEREVGPRLVDVLTVGRH